MSEIKKLLVPNEAEQFFSLQRVPAILIIIFFTAEMTPKSPKSHFPDFRDFLPIDRTHEETKVH